VNKLAKSIGGKAIALLAAAVITLTSVAGCSNGSSDQGKSTAQDSSSSAAGTSVATTNGGDFKVWMPPFGSQDVSDKNFWSEQLNPLLQKEGKTLSLEVIPWSNYEEKYLTSITAGQGPDVGYMYMEMMSSYINMDVLEPLDSYFTSEEKANYNYIDKGVIQGKQYALPIVVGNVSVLFCNMDILKKSGFTTPPKTWDDLIKYAQKIKKDSPNVQPFVQQWAEPSIGGLNDAFYPYLWQAGGSIYNNDYTKLTLDTPEAKKAAQFVYDLKYKYKILSDSVTSIKNADIKTLLNTGKAAMAVGGTSMSKDLDKAGINWDYVTSLTDKQGGTFCAADSLVMLKAASDKDLSAKVMKLMTSAPVMEKFHQQLYSAPPISKNEKYYDNAKFEKMYKNDAASFRTLAPVAGSDKIYDSLYKNLQLMMLNQVTPEQALKDSMTYSETILSKK
jgi:multiple sugar transport system substrate-binding protein